MFLLHFAFYFIVTCCDLFLERAQQTIFSTSFSDLAAALGEESLQIFQDIESGKAELFISETCETTLGAMLHPQRFDEGRGVSALYLIGSLMSRTGMGIRCTLYASAPGRATGNSTTCLEDA